MSVCSALSVLGSEKNLFECRLLQDGAEEEAAVVVVEEERRVLVGDADAFGGASHGVRFVCLVDHSSFFIM